MTATLIAIPILVVLEILQSAIISRLQLLRGTTDLVLLVVVAWALQKQVRTAWQWGIIGGLVVSLFSALPFFIPITGYLLCVGLTLLLRRRVWQVPILAMFFAVFTGTIITHLVAMIGLRLTGNIIPWVEGFNLITLPSLLLNLLLALPAYSLMGDLAGWLYPEELEV
jgi:hypothetical protein